MLFRSVAAFILIGVIAYKGRYMLSLGYNYFTWKPPIESVEILEETAANPLDKYIEATVVEPSPQSESAEPNVSDYTAQSTEAPQPIVQNGSAQPQHNSNSSTPETAPVKPSMESIAADYNTRLTELENQFRQSLNGLIVTAIADYNSGKYSTLDLAADYLEKGEELEKSSDDRFYSLLSSLKSDRKSTRLNSSHH